MEAAANLRTFLSEGVSMKSSKEKKLKSSKKKVPGKKTAGGKPRKATYKVEKRTSAKPGTASKAKGKGKAKPTAQPKKQSKPKVTGETRRVITRKSAPRAKVMSRPKPKVASGRRVAPKAKITEKKTKSVKPVVPTQKKRSMPKEDDFRTAFMKSLELKKQELQQTLDRLMKSRKEYEGQLTAGDFIDEVDDAQREISAYSQFSLIERKNKELQKIEYLLNRVAEEKDFGLCEECGTRIPKERLLLVPEATLCVACQRELEKMDSRMSMASRSTGFSPTRREVSWETTEPAEEDDNLLVEYHIGTVPNVDMDENDTEGPPEDKEDKDT
jgi:DnaK suppressor protein